MNYIITGGEFVNKGAEALILTAVNEIKRHDKQANIVVICGYGNVPVEFVEDLGINCYFVTAQLIDNMCKNKIDFKFLLKNKAKILLKKNSALNINKIKESFKKADYMLDISGYALSSKWSRQRCELFLNYINLAKKMNPFCKVCLMPQSFGPFDFDKSFLLEIKNTLDKCEVIYAREPGGIKDLGNIGITKNVKYSLDSVLLEPSINYRDLINNFERYNKTIEKEKGTKVAIIPNVRLFDKTSLGEKKLLDCYKNIADYISKSATVYLLAHSKEDIDVCKKIKNSVETNTKIILVDEVLEPFVYEEFISDFEFIIASRYHSIVHAYKKGTPAIILGWSEKYDVLAKTFDQEKYVLDTDTIEDNWKETCDLLRISAEKERAKISNKLTNLQNENNCYSFFC